MRTHACIATLVLSTAACCEPAVAMVQDNASIAGLVLLTVDDNDDLVEIELKVEAWLDEGRRVALTGPPSMLGVLKPDRVYAWPATNTVVLDPAAGLGIFGFDASDAAHRLRVLKGWTWAESEGVVEVDEAPGRGIRAAAAVHRSYDVIFDLTAASPSSVCLAFRRKLRASLFGTRAPTTDERRAYANEGRRWCQYGNVSTHSSAPPRFTVALYRGSEEPRLSLVAEWAMLRNDDPVD